MTTALIVLHVLVCFVLICVVLLQRGKGAEMGAVFGGGASSTVFGSRGAGNFLTKLTTGCAVVFMLTSLSLSYLGTQTSGDRLFEQGVVEDDADAGGEFEQLGTVEPDATDATALPPADGATTPIPPPDAGSTAGPARGGAEPAPAE